MSAFTRLMQLVLVLAVAGLWLSWHRERQSEAWKLDQSILDGIKRNNPALRDRPGTWHRVARGLKLAIYRGIR